MSFGQAIVRVFSNYANFQGRARRSEYWYFVLFYGIVMLCLSLLALIPGAVLLTVIFWLGTVVPNLAVSWRRLHDTGRSGAWVFLSLVPIGGGPHFNPVDGGGQPARDQSLRPEPQRRPGPGSAP